MNKIINFEEKKNNLINYHLSEKDLLYLYIIYAEGKDELYITDINVLAKSFGKYYNIDNFNPIYASINIIKDESGFNFVNLYDAYQDLINEGILTTSGNKYKFVSNASDEFISKLRSQYPQYVYDKFRDLMINVYFDLLYGIGKWDMLFQDEYIEGNKHPDLVTDEFIGKKRTKLIRERIKKRAIELAKDKYDNN